MPQGGRIQAGCGGSHIDCVIASTGVDISSAVGIGAVDGKFIFPRTKIDMGVFDRTGDGPKLVLFGMIKASVGAHPQPGQVSGRLLAVIGGAIAAIV